MVRPLRIAITTGDADGIGTEIVSKALDKIRPQKGVVFYLWRSSKMPKRHLDRIDRSFRRKTVSSWPEALALIPDSHKVLIDINSHLNPAMWVEICAQASHFGHIDGIATAPLSKTLIKKAGMDDIGHTEILGRVSKTKDLFMSFRGSLFNVVLATHHIPIQDVTRSLTDTKLAKAIVAANRLRLSLPPKQSALPIAVLGLNPHAGEGGMIGDAEQTVYKSAFSLISKRQVPYEGPLVPDAAFLKENWKKYSVFVASYHDQGLIPFKAFHGHKSGVHITLGLPFVRTSVDHGTAKELFGKEKADAGSMVSTLKTVIDLCRQSSIGSWKSEPIEI